jgi:hypothetical protein
LPFSQKKNTQNENQCRKKTRLNRFANLAWNDVKAWAGGENAGIVGNLFERVEGTAPLQTPPDRDPGGPGRKTDREEEALTIMSSGTKQPWTFRARFRWHAFGWRSQPTIKRMKEPASEILNGL